MTPAFIATITHDGHVLARDPLTGVVASGRTLDEAFAELRRLTASHAHTREVAGLLVANLATYAGRSPCFVSGCSSS